MNEQKKSPLQDQLVLYYGRLSQAMTIVGEPQNREELKQRRDLLEASERFEASIMMLSLLETASKEERLFRLRKIVVPAVEYGLALSQNSMRNIGAAARDAYRANRNEGTLVLMNAADAFEGYAKPVKIALSETMLALEEQAQTPEQQIVQILHCVANQLNNDANSLFMNAPGEQKTFGAPLQQIAFVLEEGADWAEMAQNHESRDVYLRGAMATYDEARALLQSYVALHDPKRALLASRQEKDSDTYRASPQGKQDARLLQVLTDATSRLETLDQEMGRANKKLRAENPARTPVQPRVLAF